MLKKILLSCLLLFAFSPSLISHAEESYSDLFISVGDAMMKTKAEDWDTVKQLIDQLETDWQVIDQTDSKMASQVTTAIKELQKASDTKQKEPMLTALTNMSHALVAFEKEKNPVDTEEQRLNFKAAMKPVIVQLQSAVAKKDAIEIKKSYDQTLTTWNRNELVVREQSIAFYGKIETQMGFLRIALSQDEKDFNQITKVSNELIAAIESFSSGETLQVKEEGHSLQTLIDLLTKTNEQIQRNELDKAVQSLQEFISVWPSVEGEIRTRNGSLYTQLENQVPVIAGKLTSEKADLSELQTKLKKFNQSIKLMQKKTSYTIWDAALIMLREGLEALLIVTALIAFLRKAKVPKQEKWIWLGAFLGLVISIAAAVGITMTFSSATAGANREIIEGVTGILAVVMMIGVGAWLHQKSNMQTWNRFINKQMGAALSTGSIFSMALVSFFAIFREGAETVIFYAGMAPSMKVSDLLIGILVALAILTISAFLFIRYSTKISITPFFKIATLLIYFLAFKILGVSIHALQLTNYIETTQILSLPVVNWLGFYPTWETIVPQLVLLGIIGLVGLRIKIKRQSDSKVQ